MVKPKMVSSESFEYVKHDEFLKLGAELHRRIEQLITMQEESEGRLMREIKRVQRSEPATAERHGHWSGDEEEAIIASFNAWVIRRMQVHKRSEKSITCKVRSLMHAGKIETY